MFRPSGHFDISTSRHWGHRDISTLGSSRSAPLLMPSAQLSCFDTTTGWWAECLEVGFVVRRWLIEGGAVPCLSPVVTDFPEISRKFEGLRLELVSRNFALVQQKDVSGPREIQVNHTFRSNVWKFPITFVFEDSQLPSEITGLTRRVGRVTEFLGSPCFLSTH